MNDDYLNSLNEFNKHFKQLGGNYVLEGKTPKRVDSFLEWAIQFEKQNRVVKQTQIQDVKVSTVFLGIDHGYGGEPLLFETMIFGGENDGYCDRYATWEEAEEGHLKACELVVA
jgi:hypothetical protein